MIGVYAVCQVKTDKRAEFEQLVRAFIQESRTHQGCLTYDCGAVQGKAGAFAFVECWASQTDLDAHLASPFFKENAPALLDMTENGLDIDVVDFLAS